MAKRKRKAESLVMERVSVVDLRKNLKKHLEGEPVIVARPSYWSTDFRAILIPVRPEIRTRFDKMQYSDRAAELNLDRNDLVELVLKDLLARIGAGK